MKHSKRYQTCVGIVVWIIVLLIVTPLHTMISQKSTSKRIRVQQPIQSERYKNKLIWVKTSDNVRMELPQWQIDQMKAVLHKGAGTQYHWVDAPMITSDELALVQKALDFADNLEKFREFYANLSQGQKDSLINSASKLEMQGLASLLMAYGLPIDVQSKIGATVEQVAGVIAPVVDYLKDLEKIPLAHKGAVKEVAFSPDGNRMLSAAYGVAHNVILYDVKNGKEIKSLVTETLPEPCIAFSPDGNYIAVGSKREVESLIVCDGITGEKINALSNYPVNCITFTSDSSAVFAGVKFGSDVDYSPFAFGSQSSISILRGLFTGLCSEVVHSMAYRPNSNDIILGSDIDPSICNNLNLYDCKTYKKIRSFVGLSKGVPRVAFSADGKYLVGGTVELILWDVETGNEVRRFKYHSGRISSVAFHPSGDYIAVASQSSFEDVVIFDCKTGDPIKNFGWESNVRCIAFSPDGYSLMCGVSEGLILFKLIKQQTLDFIAKKLNLAQARLLYRLYVAKINHVSVILDTKDLDYQLYLTLPIDVQEVVKAFLPFELALDVAKDIAEKAVQEKMKELREALFYESSRLWGMYEKKHDEKVKAVKDAMQKLDKNSIEYKACERLLNELELEKAFV